MCTSDSLRPKGKEKPACTILYTSKNNMIARKTKRRRSIWYGTIAGHEKYENRNSKMINYE
jgi:hypothetical protein